MYSFGYIYIYYIYYIIYCVLILYDFIIVIMGYNVPYVALRFQMFFLHQSFGSRHGLGFTERISAVPSRFMFVWAKIVVACIFLFTSIHTHMSIYIHAYIYILYIYRDSIIL
jgi:hypothetical protein